VSAEHATATKPAPEAKPVLDPQRGWPEGSRRHPWLVPRIAVPVALAILAVQAPFLHALLRGPAPSLRRSVRGQVRPRHARRSVWSNGGLWQIVDGQLYSRVSATTRSGSKRGSRPTCGSSSTSAAKGRTAT